MSTLTLHDALNLSQCKPLGGDRELIKGIATLAPPYRISLRSLDGEINILIMFMPS